MSVARRDVGRLTEADFNFLTHLATDKPWLQINPQALSELWASCDSTQKQDLIVELINRFIVLEGLGLVKELDGVVSLVVDQWGLAPSHTTIIAVSDDSETDGSQAVLHMIKSRFSTRTGWRESNFKNSLVGYKDYLRSGRNYVLFDDFVGSGKKLSEKTALFESYLEKTGLKGCSIYVCALAAMEHSKEHFAKYTFGAAMWLDKGIDGFNSTADAGGKKKLMRELEQGLMRRFNGNFVPSLGYRGSQALFSIMGQNCPNNVFPIFWWPKNADRTNRATILSRFM